MMDITRSESTQIRTETANCLLDVLKEDMDSFVSLIQRTSLPFNYLTRKEYRGASFVHLLSNSKDYFYLDQAQVDALGLHLKKNSRTYYADNEHQVDNHITRSKGVLYPTSSLLDSTNKSFKCEHELPFKRCIDRLSEKLNLGFEDLYELLQDTVIQADQANKDQRIADNLIREDKKRIRRVKKYSDRAYYALLCEFGITFLCHDLGYKRPHKTLSYALAPLWIKGIELDPNYLFRAAIEADRAAQLIVRTSLLQTEGVAY